MTRTMHGAGDVLGGKFRVIRTLGAGGMGVVYEVQHTITFHRRALKLLLVTDRDESNSVTEDESASARLLREASAAGRIGSPHIVETFDAGMLPTGETYVVMELLEGETFADLFRRRGPLSVAEVADLVGQVCNGLQAAHDAGIIHRDLKPGNLWVMQRDGKPFVKILDFGISKFDTKLTDETELTQKGAVLGTPYYMSPEQLDRGTIDGRADIYALGIVLYVALTGQRPYGSTSLTEMIGRLARGECTPILSLRPDLPPELVDIVMRAMAPNRAMRISSARELAAQLAPFADPGAFGAVPPSAVDIPIDVPSAPAELEARSAVPASTGPHVTSSRRSTLLLTAAAAGTVAAVAILGLVLASQSSDAKTPTASPRPSSAPSAVAEPSPKRAASPLAPPAPPPAVAPPPAPADAPSSEPRAPKPRPNAPAPPAATPRANAVPHDDTLHRANPYQ